MFLVLFLRLRVLEGLAESEHASAAVLMVAPIVVMTEAVLVLSCLDKKHDALLVGARFGFDRVCVARCCFNHL